MHKVHLPEEIWDNELVAGSPAALDWIWDGLLAAGNITLLTATWKAGKTTLLSLLLARRKSGGTLAGLPVRPGKTVVVSEESKLVWDERARRLDFGGNVCFMCKPFLSVPTAEQWRALLGRVLELHKERGVDLLVIDPLAPLLPAENSARCMFDVLLPLQALTRLGLSVLALHHPRKGHPAQGQAARGSGALLGHVDISLEMRHPGGAARTRRRRLVALSRHAATPGQFLFELNADATDYVVLPDEQPDSLQTHWPVLQLVLADAPQKLTRDDILDEWPADFDKPSPVTLRGWLERTVAGGLVLREGSGRKSDPFRYWLPAQEALWRQRDPMYDTFEQLQRDQNLPFQSLRERKQVQRDNPTPYDPASDDASSPDFI